MEDIKKKLKSLNDTQIKKIYCKMMKLKKTSLKKNKMISKLLAPLQTKYRMTLKRGKKEDSSGEIFIPIDVFQKITEYLPHKAYLDLMVTEKKRAQSLWPIRPAGDRLLLDDPSLLGNSMYAGALRRKNEYLKRENEYLKLKDKYSKLKITGRDGDYSINRVEDFVDYLLEERPKNVQYIYKIINETDVWREKDINKETIINEIKTYELLLSDLNKIKYLIEEIGIETNYLLYETVLDTIEERYTEEDIIEIIKYLLEKGANVNYEDEDGNSLLLIAILNDRFNIVKYLVERGAIVTQTEINEMEDKIAENAGTELTKGEEKILRYLKKKFAEQQRSS